MAFHTTPMLAPLPTHEQDTICAFSEAAEHGFLGDSVTLQWPDETKTLASQHKLKLQNGLELTYGQINYLAGDYFGTLCHPGPISDSPPMPDGQPSHEQIARFRAAYNTLAESHAGKMQAEAVMNTARVEIDKLNAALKNLPVDPDAASRAYARMNEAARAFDYTLDTNGRYPLLAAVNFDHFGRDAVCAYNAGHALALGIASDGDLPLAYTVSAFADHYLEDLFSSGHLRTPRRFLHSKWMPAWDICARYMHAEDSALGLKVSSMDGKDEWMAYGDTRLLDTANDANKQRCMTALQASVDEVFEAYRTQNGTLRATAFKAWTFAPSLESAMSTNQRLSPLFTPDGRLRSNIADRLTWKHHILGMTDLAVTIWQQCVSSGLWRYPMKFTKEKP